MAKQRRVIDLHWPSGGLNRQAAVQNQPPFTTAYALNVRTFDPILTRGRGGSRPGLSKAFSLQLGSPGPIQLLDAAVYVNGPALTTNILVAIADGTLYTNFVDAATMASVSGSFAATGNYHLQGAQVGLYYFIADYRTGLFGTGLAGSDGTISNSGGNSKLTSLNTDFGAEGVTSSDYIYIAHSTGWVNANNPKTYTTGSISIIGGVATGSGTTWVSGMNGGTLTIFANGIFQETMTILKVNSTTSMLVSDSNINYATGGGITITYSIGYSYDSEDGIFQVSSVSGKTITLSGLQGLTSGDTGATWQIGTWPKMYDTRVNTLANMNVTFGIPPLGCTLATEYRGRLVFAGPGSAWYMSYVNDPTNWDYGADPGDVQRAIAGSSSPNGGLGPPLTALMNHSDQYLVFAGLDSIAVLNGDPGAGGQFQQLSNTIGCLAPNAWTGLPDGSIMFLSRDGLYSIPAGGGYPTAVSRPMLPAELLDIDPATNWISLAYDVVRRGVRISITPHSGTVTKTINVTTITGHPAMGNYVATGATSNSHPVYFCPENGCYLFVAQLDSTEWVIRDGFPTGVNIGLIGPFAASGPLGDYSDGVITQVTANGYVGTHYWFDLATSGFWPDAYGQAAVQPSALFRWDQLSGAGTEYLLGGLDGYLRQVDVTATTDDGNAGEGFGIFASCVAYGPLRPVPVGYEAQVTMISADLDTNSQAVGYSIFTSGTAQGVVNAIGSTPQSSGSFAAGRNTSAYPGCRGVAMAIVLAGVTPWAIEGLRMQVREGGLLR